MSTNDKFMKLTVEREEAVELCQVHLDTSGPSFPVGALFVEQGMLIMKVIPDVGGLVSVEHPIIARLGQSLTFKIDAVETKEDEEKRMREVVGKTVASITWLDDDEGLDEGLGGYWSIKFDDDMEIRCHMKEDD